MKLNTLTSAAALSLGLLISAPTWATLCPGPFSSVIQNSVRVAKEAEWRSAQTNANATNSVSATNPTREKRMKAFVKQFEKDIVTDWATPVWEFMPAAGVRSKVVFQTGGYGTGEVSKIQVSKLGPNGILEGTLLLPVSGHLGPESASRWSVTDTYNILVEVGGQRRANLVSNARSLNLVTVQEIQLQMVKGEVVRILYDRSGSAGPYGYIEGRALDLVWDGT